MKLAVVNKSSTNLADVTAWADACRIQLHEAARHWGLVAPNVGVYTRLRDVPHGYWPVSIFDDADQAGALGYHDESPTGKPYGRVFVKTAQEYGVAPSSVLSHELLEALVDPHVNLWADDGSGREFALEVGDPVQDGSYDIHGISVSNYVFPAYFDVRSKAVPRDRLGILSDPFSISAGGYAIVRTAGGERQVFGQLDSYRDAAHGMHGARSDWRF